MPQAAATMNMEDYIDRVSGISEYVASQCDELKRNGVHVCNSRCDLTCCELMARMSFRSAQACYLLTLVGGDRVIRSSLLPLCEHVTRAVEISPRDQNVQQL
jgi:hypothetical protein